MRSSVPICADMVGEGGAVVGLGAAAKVFEELTAGGLQQIRWITRRAPCNCPKCARNMSLLLLVSRQLKY